MAVKTWDTSRVGGGTYELERDSSGNYKLKTVGFDQVNKLNLPDLLTQDKTTTKTDTTKTDTTTDTAAPYKQLAKANLGGDTQQDYTGTMVKGGLSERGNIDRTTSMTTGSTGDGPWTMRSEGGQFPGRSRIDPTTTGAWDKGQWGPQVSGGIVKDDDPWKAGNWKDYVYMAGDNTQERFQGEKEIMKSDAINKDAHLFPGVSEKDVASVRTPEFPGRSKTIGGRDIREFPGRSKTIGGREISDKYKYARGPQQVNVPDKTTGLQKVKSKASDTLKKFKISNLSITKIAGDALGAVLGAITPELSPTQKLNKSYFNVRKGDSTGRRIAGNPATDLYAGMNRTSDYGNLERAGNKRIATREKTIAKYEGKWDKEKMDRFKATTNKMKGDASKYKASKQKATQGPAGGATTGGGGGGDKGSDSGRVICTELHRTKEMTTHDWIRDIKFTYNNLSKDHIKGYLFWAVPTVNLIKKYPTYRKIWKHLAQHRANDIAWRLNQGKFDLLGRIYAGIGEPLCWLIGKCVSDKQLKELKLNSWRRA